MKVFISYAREDIEIAKKLRDDLEKAGIKRILADFFANKLTAETNRIWNEKGLTDDDMDKWLKEMS